MNPTTSYEATRRFFARFITAVTQVSDTRIINAFANTKREHFVGPAPWHIRAGSGYIITETDDPIVLYQDVLVGLDPAR